MTPTINLVDYDSFEDFQKAIKDYESNIPSNLSSDPGSSDLEKILAFTTEKSKAGFSAGVNYSKQLFDKFQKRRSAVSPQVDICSNASCEESIQARYSSCQDAQIIPKEPSNYSSKLKTTAKGMVMGLIIGGALIGSLEATQLYHSNKATEQRIDNLLQTGDIGTYRSDFKKFYFKNLK